MVQKGTDRKEPLVINEPIQTHDLASTVPDLPSSGMCRHCRAPLRHTFVDLGLSPPCQSYLSAEQLNCGETFYPLQAFVCERCFLVQLQDYVTPEDIFSEYAYFS